jgi:hypothetical protein
MATHELEAIRTAPHAGRAKSWTAPGFRREMPRRVSRRCGVRGRAVTTRPPRASAAGTVS